MADFNKKDVIKIAKGMLESHTIYILDHNNGDYIECIHCWGDHRDDASKIEHGLDCPVLIARDVLTRNL